MAGLFSTISLFVSYGVSAAYVITVIAAITSGFFFMHYDSCKYLYRRGIIADETLEHCHCIFGILSLLGAPIALLWLLEEGVKSTHLYHNLYLDFPILFLQPYFIALVTEICLLGFATITYTLWKGICSIQRRFGTRASALASSLDANASEHWQHEDKRNA
jgi:hypothetical protein